MKRSLGIAAIAVCALLAGLAAAAWFGIDWTEEGANVYPGGLVLRDAAGEVLRVSLGEKDTLILDTRTAPYNLLAPNALETLPEAK